MAVAPDILGMEDVHRLSVEAYHCLVEAGWFDDDDHVELLEGVIVTMSPRSARHDEAVAWLNEWLGDHVERPRYQVRVEGALTLGRSEPQPDVSVIERGAPRPYHPARAALVIEVSVSSLPRDLAVKPIVYAEAGIPEYWVLDLDGRRLVVHTKPQADGYAARREYVENERVTATALTLPELDLAELLRAAHD